MPQTVERVHDLQTCKRGPAPDNEHPFSTDYRYETPFSPKETQTPGGNQDARYAPLRSFPRPLWLLEVQIGFRRSSETSRLSSD